MHQWGPVQRDAPKRRSIALHIIAFYHIWEQMHPTVVAEFSWESLMGMMSSNCGILAFVWEQGNCECNENGFRRPWLLPKRLPQTHSQNILSGVWWLWKQSELFAMGPVQFRWPRGVAENRFTNWGFGRNLGWFCLGEISKAQSSLTLESGQ